MTGKGSFFKLIVSTSVLKSGRLMEQKGSLLILVSEKGAFLYKLKSAMAVEASHRCHGIYHSLVYFCSLHLTLFIMLTLVLFQSLLSVEY